VSFDAVPDNAAFAKKFNFNFPLLTDADRKMGVAYGAADDTGAKNVRRVGVVIGPDGKVKFYSPKVSAAAFPQEALQYV
jgi:peroxiredoxin Q/BCP